MTQRVNTEISATQDVSVTANATMLAEFLDALHIDQFDLVGSGGSIAQILAATHPKQVRGLAGSDHPRAGRMVRLKSARIFFPEERWQAFSRELRNHWSA